MEFNGKLFKKIKKDRKITNLKLAEMLGVSRNTIYRWETGQTKPQHIDILAICEILHIEPDIISDIKLNKYSAELEKIKEERLYNTNSTVLQDLIKSKSLTEKQASAVINLTGQLNDYKNIHKRYKYLIDSYEEILNNIDQIVYVKDKQHRYKYVNESFLTITETNIYKDDITNISYSRIFENSDYFELLKLENKVFKTGLPIKDSRIIIPNTNGNRIGLVNIIPRFSSNDQTVTEILVTIKDSTQIFYAIEKQEQLIDAINSLDEYVFIRNDTSIQNNKYIFLSDSVKKIYGYTAEEFYEDQNLWYDLILEEDKEKKKFKTFSMITDTDFENGKLKLGFHWKIFPYFRELKERFTKYDLLNIKELSSSYSIRFYEFIKQYENIGVRTLDIDYLKEKLDIKDKYKRFDALRIYVIDKARDELKEKSELYFEYTLNKHGRKVLSITLEIKLNIRKKEKDFLKDSITNYFSNYSNTDFYDHLRIYYEEKRPNLSDADKKYLQTIILKKEQYQIINETVLYRFFQWAQNRKDISFNGNNEEIPKQPIELRLKELGWFGNYAELADEVLPEAIEVYFDNLKSEIDKIDKKKITKKALHEYIDQTIKSQAMRYYNIFKAVLKTPNANE